ncbi:putative Ulp1 protease family catalytic domain-containing protein [Rosa chinensis]|uniref:Putative Ulp1 protease family catalytic domain-containing protein n=1 Tax=Rosa chinensis TaxID=74649 RepID=A0A2P6QKF2_ROSCH|nr:putative Ulp1 protease family catalytic domain-containing protein [Rosa chinensis]
MYNAHKGRKGQSSVLWKNLSGIPPQPNAKDCGYFVMRYMRDIIEDKDLTFVNKWERRSNLVYSQEDIDVMRCEGAKFVVKSYM